MSIKPFLISLCCAFGSVVCHGQTLYDLSDVYLKNADFNANYDHAVGETGNVAQQICELPGWNKDFSVNYTIAGVYQIGTNKTFNGAKVPDKAFDGSTSGGVLALSTGWEQALKYYQTVTLPAGNYTMKSAFFNGSDKSSGISLMAWLPDGGTPVKSSLTSFLVDNWTEDVVHFTLTETTTGRIQLGFQAPESRGSANFARVCMDFIHLYRDTPVGKFEVDIKKHDLLNDIDQAKQQLGSTSNASATAFRESITKAQEVYDNASATLENVMQARVHLAQAAETFAWANPTGEAPLVTTDSRFARGSTMAFARIQVKGENIVEQGVCWSTSPNSTIRDERTTEVIHHKGQIYWMKNLLPATCYYIRAYAITQGKLVGYGNNVKCYTLPKGTLSYTLRDGGDNETKARIEAAMKTAVNWWNNLTSIHGVTFNVGFNSGTPTADCSYGGYIRVGANTAYQRTGTMLHEMAHGVGVGTHNPWWDGRMRSNGNRGLWLGDRATAVLRFWENDNTATLTGDHIHFWPYGINGAHEDDGSDALYIIQSLIVQALGEDGLPPSGGFATPAYSFEQENNQRYYLKNEAIENGRYSTFVTEQKDGRLALKELSSEDVLTNDSAAWHVIFNAEKSLYNFKNVATGHVITYDTHTSSMRTGEADGATDDVLFHLMRGRKDVVEGSSVRGYWMIHNDGSESPKVMSAENGSTLTTATYNLGNDATAQRWLILDKNTMESIEMQAKKDYSKQLDDYLDLVKKLRSTPHREDVAGTDKTFDDGLETIKSRRLTATSAGKLSSLVAEAHALAYNFLSHVTPLSKYEPFDLTFMVMNPGMDQLNGWTGKPALNHSSGEFYQATFDFNQTISNLPVGSYQLRVQAFQRPGSAETAYQAHMSGDDKVTTEIYLGDRSCKVKQAVTEARETPIGVGNESMLPSNPAKYIPNDMLSASEYFANGLYENNVSARVETENSSLKLGVRCTFSDNMYWSIFDNFRLYYFGNMPFEEVMPVKKIQVQTQSVSDRVFTIDGRAINMHGKGVESLPHGVYIIGGKKIVR